MAIASEVQRNVATTAYASAGNAGLCRELRASMERSVATIMISSTWVKAEWVSYWPTSLEGGFPLRYW